MRQISAANGRFVARFDYNPALVESAKCISGRRWDPADKVWTFPMNLAVAQQLYDTFGGCDFGFTLEYTEAVRQLQGNIEASRAKDCTTNYPIPEGLSYYPFQKAGIAFARDKRHVLIGDDPGLGKTVQAIGVINSRDDLRKILIICPATGKVTPWRRLLEKFLVHHLTIAVVDAQTEEWPAAQVVIINYDIINRWRQELRQREWDLLILDETHRLKNPKAGRTVEVFGRKNRREPEKDVARIPSRMTICLTGSPMPNRPIELWPLLRDAGIFTNWEQYVTRYCAGYQENVGRKTIWVVDGASNMDELQTVLRSCWMIRRRKSEVLTELPPKRRRMIELPATGLSRAVKAEWEGYRKQGEALEGLLLAVEKAKVSDSDEEHAEAVKALRRGTMYAMEQISRARHDLAIQMLPLMIEYIADALESTEGKVLVFAHHHDVVEGIAKAFPDISVTLYGPTSDKRRIEAQDRFQGDPAVRLFVGSIGAAGEVITLTAATHVIFAEGDWVPGRITQAEDRAHRIGQHDSVLYDHLVLEGSLGATMARRVVDKQEVIDAALDDPVGLGALPILPIPEPASANVSRKRIHDEALNITPEEIIEIHGKLRYLAGMCDYASTVDGQGFNKFDTNLGHWLAAADRLTPKQAALGRKILAKYHRQLEGV